MTEYAVVTKYYNSGKVERYIKKVKRCKIVYRELKKYILTVDVYATYEEAKIYHPEANIKIL